MYIKYYKRLLDISVSIVVIVVLFPILLFVVLFIFLEDGMPVIFKQKRSGRDGSIFTFYKFRSMPSNTKELTSVAAKSVIITRIGKILRRTNIDELPQLFNILKGDMSLVGPRPALLGQKDLILLRENKSFENVRPGLTGLAQVNAYDGMSIEAKVKWEVEYCKTITLRNDLLIVLRTVGYLFKKQPVY